MSVIFGGKLLAPKTKNVNSSLEIEKNLQTLSKREQELLEELQSTRATIVKELVRISPNVKPDNLDQWKDTLNSYETKLKSSTINSRPGTTLGSNLSLTSPMSSKRARTSHKQSKQQPPRTLQSLPIMTTTGEFAFSANLKRDDPLVLPIVTLPSVTLNFTNNNNNNNGNGNKSKEIVNSSTNSNINLNINKNTEQIQLRKQSSPQVIDTKISLQFILSNLDSYSLQFILNYYSIKIDEWKDISLNFNILKDMLSSSNQNNNNNNNQQQQDDNLQTVFNSFRPFNRRNSQILSDTDFQFITTTSSSNVPIKNTTTSTTTITKTLNTFSTTDLNRTLPSQTSSKLPPIKKINENNNNNNHNNQSLFQESSTYNSIKTSEFESTKKLHMSRSFSFKPSTATNSSINMIENSKYSSKSREKIKLRKHSNSYEKSSAELLRQELYKSLDSMQKYTSDVKQSIINVQELVALNNPRARAFITTMAADQLCTILTKIGRQELKRGWNSWCLSIKIDKLIDKTKKVEHFLLLRQLAINLNELVISVLRYNFLEWVKYCVAERLRLEMELKTAAAITIQRVVRGNIGREKARKIVEGNKFAKLHRSLIKLQALFRGKIQRWKYLKYRRDILEETSCELIQKIVRGFLGRRRVNRIRSYASKVSAAITIQAAARGRKGRLIASALRLLRLKNKVIVKIQALSRGYIGRMKVATILKEKVQTAAVIKIQARIRGVLTRMNLHHRKRELEEYRLERNRYATKIQAVYRGFRARVMFRYYMEEHNQEVLLKNKSATTIQCLIRMFLARHKVSKLEQDRLDRWIADASIWKEIWSEDSGAWFYLNQTTEEALWEPPSIGYTKVDGQLVLRNGKIIDPPDLTGKKKRMAGQEHLCVECVKRVAIRKCNECGDNFCTKCYKETHSSGSRKQHTYEAIGPIECTECEEELAERWCISCDEPYCDSCWRKVHSKGKRRYHPFSQVQEDGHIDSRIFTIDGEQIHNYDASYSQNRYEEEVAATQIPQSNILDYETDSQWANESSQYGDYDQSSQYYDYEYGNNNDNTTTNNSNTDNNNSNYNYNYNDESTNWSEYYDENNVVYWYNSVTGESTYENPYSNY